MELRLREALPEVTQRVSEEGVSLQSSLCYKVLSPGP